LGSVGGAVTSSTSIREFPTALGRPEAMFSSLALGDAIIRKGGEPNVLRGTARARSVGSRVVGSSESNSQRVPMVKTQAHMSYAMPSRAICRIRSAEEAAKSFRATTLHTLTAVANHENPTALVMQ
jgi:hypothetical protein